MKNILITGASGMLAQALIHRLSAENKFNIFAVSSKQLPPSGGRILPVPLGQEERVLRENGIDCLVHCAFPRNVQPDLWADGIEYGFKILFSAKRYGVKSVIHISSQSLYGWDRTEPADEGSPVFLNSPYTAGKFCTEQLTNKLFADIPHTNIRLATLIGPHSAERVPNRLIADLLAHRDLHIKGGGQIFSFLNVSDAANALYTLISSPAERWRPFYNIGTEESLSLSEIALLCVSAGQRFGISGPRILTEAADIKLDNRLCCQAFFDDFGWRAERSLSESISEIFAVALEKKI